MGARAEDGQRKEAYLGAQRVILIEAASADPGPPCHPADIPIYPSVAAGSRIEEVAMAKTSMPQTVALSPYPTEAVHHE